MTEVLRNQNSPLISVLIPVWNAERTLRRALTSLQRQHYSNWECVLVDDGSTDTSRQIEAHFASRDARFKLSAIPHAGIVAALNHGLAASAGEFVARFDADDLMHPERLSRQLETLRSKPELEAVGCQVALFPRRNLMPKHRAYQDWLNSLSDAAAIYRDRFVECPVAHPTLMCRAAVLQSLGYRDLGWPEDYDLVLRLLSRGAKLGTVPLPLHAWRDHPRRLSRTDPIYSLGSFVSCKAHHLARTWLEGHSTYVLWGYGDTGRALCGALLSEGKRPSQILDLHPGRVGQLIQGVRVLHPSDARARQNRDRVVASVAGIERRTELRGFARELGLVEGVDYVVAA